MTLRMVCENRPRNRISETNPKTVPIRGNTFCGICRRQCHFEFKTVIGKSCAKICAKLKDVDRINLFHYDKFCVSIALKYIYWWKKV